MAAESNRVDMSPASDFRGSKKTSGFLEGLAQDLSYAFRQLRRSPGFAAVAVLTLALGIGANTAIFTLVNTVMLTRLPVGHPEELVLFHWMSHSKGPYVWNSSSSYGGCDMHDPGSGNSNCSFSYPAFINFKTNAKSFQGIAAYGGGFGGQLDMKGQATRTTGQYVSGDFFSVLEVHPAYGRVLNPSDDVPGAQPVLVLEFNYWQKQFGGDPNVVGTTVLLNGVTFVIAGITPPEFYGIAPGSRANMWLPLHVREALRPTTQSDRYEARTIWLYIIGRLKPGVTAEQARVETEILYRGSLASAATAAAASPTKYEQEHPRKTPLDTDLSVALTSAERGLANLRSNYSSQLYILMGVTGLVLLIACANIANLLLARSSARRKEIAIRLAIGASRGRLLRQLLTESLLLAALGGAAGLITSYWASRGIVLIVFRQASSAFLAMFHPNFLVFGFAAGIATVAAVLFGLIPALTSTRISPGATLKAAGGLAGGSGSHGDAGNRLGSALVAAEMAVALILVIGAGLFLRTLIHLETLDPGFQSDHLLTFGISPSAAKLSDEKSAALVQEIQRRLAALPGVLSVTWSGDLFLVGNLWTTDLQIQEHPELGDVDTQAMNIGPGFFETLKIRLLAGRTITQTDCRKDSQVVWVNQTFVSRYLKNSNAVGLHLMQDKKPIEIVGVVADTKFASLRSEFRPGMFLPVAGGDSTFQMRTAGNPEALENAVRKVVSDVASNIPISNMQALQVGIDSNLASENSMARLASGFGLLALILAAIGIYGVLAYSVARRTSEIAIRMSLGAMPGNIMRLVLKEGLRPAVIGAVAGLLGSWGLTRLVADLLYGVKPLDAITFAGATLALLLIAALACYIPARRAMRVTPMTALRYE
jgi:predicted permease